MSMQKSTFLKFNNINTCNHLSKNIFFEGSALSISNFALNTWDKRSGLSWDFSLNCKLSWISFHIGLHVIVRKISGFPYFCANAITSSYLCLISLGPPMKEAGNMTFRPTLEPSVWPIEILSRTPSRISVWISFCLFHWKSSLDVSIFT